MMFLIHTCSTKKPPNKPSQKNPRGMGIILRKCFLEIRRSPCPSPWLLFQFNSSEIRRITLSPFFSCEWSHILPPRKTLQAWALQQRSLRAPHSFVIMVLFRDMWDGPSGGKRDPNSDLSNSRWVLFSLPSEMQNPPLLLLILPSGRPSPETKSPHCLASALSWNSWVKVESNLTFLPLLPFFSTKSENRQK